MGCLVRTVEWILRKEQNVECGLWRVLRGVLNVQSTEFEVHYHVDWEAVWSVEREVPREVRGVQGVEFEAGFVEC